MARLVKFGDFVGPGEQLTAAYLEKHLPNGWLVICNKELVNPDGSSREVDFVVIGANAVFVLEEKHWKGVIDGNDRRWYPRFGPVRSPIATNLQSVKRLHGLLQSNVPATKTLPGPFVYGRVVLSHPDVELRVEDLRVNTHVLRLVGCEEFLVRDDQAQPSSFSIQPYREQISRTLELLQTRPATPSRIGDYEAIESRGTVGSIRTVLARHDDGQLRLLRLIERPVTADIERQEALKLALLREYNALKSLATIGRTPPVDQYFSWGDEQYWVVPIHLAAGPSLAESRLAGDPDRSSVGAVIRDCFEGLADIHAAGILHRDISPEKIYFQTPDTMGFTDFALARITGQETISGVLPLDGAPNYRAPEVLADLSLATTRTDVYSLAASICYWLTGEEPDEAGVLSRVLESVTTIVGSGVAAVLDRCLAGDPDARPEASAVAAELRALESAKPTFGEGSAQPNELLDDQYRVIRVLGKGATAVTYLALDTLSGEQFVLKRIVNPEWVRRLAKNEFRALLDLDHPCLPKVYDVRMPDKPFHLKLEYVRGSPLVDMMSTKRGDLAFAMHVADELLSVLDYLSTRHMIHRDLSPSNILVPDEEAGHVRLIDFGVATSTSDTTSVVGTPRYRAPEVDGGLSWSELADLYSLATILIELLLGRVPYDVENGVASKHQIRPPNGQELDRFDSRVLDVLFKAADPDPARRFGSANEFREALRGSLISVPTVEGVEVVNPHVDRLRATYRNSLVGNAENRGLDSEFAVATYVPSRLDMDLLPKVLDGKLRLVVLSGNPGDGKTAFLQHARLRLIEVGADSVDDGPAGWTYRYRGQTFRALYDASESDQERTADDLLEQVLAPLATDAPLDPYTGLIAVNDGRLLQFIESIDAVRFALVRRSLIDQLSGSTGDDGILIVDLKHRSLVTPTDDSLGLFEDILEEFTSPESWRACDECVARIECPIRFNALSLSTDGLGSTTRPAIGRLLEGIHLRRERRPTLRDLRSALAYIVTSDVGCSDVHAERARGLQPLADGRRYYFNAAFDGAGSPDLVLDEWTGFDPADVASPGLDRHVYFNRTDAASLARLFVASQSRPQIQTTIGPLDDERTWLGSIKRRYALEGVASEVGEASTAPERLSPYQHFDAFKRALSDPEHSTVARILRGISHADGVPTSLIPAGLGLTMGDPSDDFVVVKVFGDSEFTLGRGMTSRPFVEVTPDTIRLEHVSGTALSVGLDLFEYLSRCADGLVSGSEEQLALAEDLVRFKNELLSRPSGEVILSERGRPPYRVTLDSGRIALAPA